MSDRDKLYTAAICSSVFSSVLAIVSFCLVLIGWIANQQVSQEYHFLTGMMAIITSMCYAVTAALKTGQPEFADVSSPAFAICMSVCWFITGTLILSYAAFRYTV